MSDQLTLPDLDDIGEYADEYIAEAKELRRQGLTLSSYVQSRVRDDIPMYTLDASIAASIDAKAEKAFGPMPNLKNPLAFGMS